MRRSDHRRASGMLNAKAAKTTSRVKLLPLTALLGGDENG
jgi:hypothetical protein